MWYIVNTRKRLPDSTIFTKVGPVQGQHGPTSIISKPFPAATPQRPQPFVRILHVQELFSCQNASNKKPWSCHGPWLTAHGLPCSSTGFPFSLLNLSGRSPGNRSKPLASGQQTHPSHSLARPSNSKHQPVTSVSKPMVDVLRFGNF